MVTVDFLDCFSKVRVETQPQEHQDHTHPLSAEEGVGEDYHRAENGEKFTSRCENRACEWTKVHHCQEDEVLCVWACVWVCVCVWGGGINNRHIYLKDAICSCKLYVQCRAAMYTCTATCINPK